MSETIQEIREYDIGTKFLITMKDQDGDVLDISQATSKKIYFQKPDGTTLNKDASFETNGDDGLIYYTSVENDLTPEGTWQIQAMVVLPDGTWRSTIRSFQVHENIIDPS